MLGERLLSTAVSSAGRIGFATLLRYRDIVYNDQKNENGIESRRPRVLLEEKLNPEARIRGR